MKLTVALIAALAISGCASVPMQKAENESHFVCDVAQMQAVDRIARAQRTEVVWVNCPLISRDRVKVS